MTADIVIFTWDVILLLYNDETIVLFNEATSVVVASKI